MGQKKAEDQNKELFAYEMTQVILTLKGEFAAVSGKKMGYEKNRVSEKARNLPKTVLEQTKIPSIEVKHIEMGRGLSEKLAVPVGIIDNAEACGQAEPVTRPEIKLPVVSCVSFEELPPAETQKAKVNLPKTKKFALKVPGTEVREIRMEFPKVQRFALPAEQAATGEMAEVKLPATKPVAVPKVPALSIPQMEARPAAVCVPVRKKPPVPALLNELEQSNIRVKIPAAEKMSVEMPSVAKEPELRMTALDSAFVPVKKVVVQTPVPSVTLQKQQIAVPEVYLHRFSQPVTVSVQQMPAAPEVPDVQKERDAFLSAIAEFF